MKTLLPISVLLACALSFSAFGKEYGVFDVVGDSISAGVNPETGGLNGWIQMLFGEGGTTRTLDSLWPDIEKNNSAVSSSEASDWAGAGYAPMQQVLDHEPDLAVVFIGGNDMLAYCADGDVSPQEFAAYRANLTTILTKLRSLPSDPDIVLVNYYDLFDGYSEALPSLFSAFRPLSAAAVEGNRIIREVAEEMECHLVDGVYDAFLHHCYGESFGDTDHEQPDYVRLPLWSFDIHPNTAGHAEILRLVFQKLQALKADNTPTPARAAANYWLCYE